MTYDQLDKKLFVDEKIPPLNLIQFTIDKKSMDMKNYPMDPYTYTNHFLVTIDEWINTHKHISFLGLDTMPIRHAIFGVTQQIDELHYLYRDKLVIFENEYFYHKRLNPDIKCITTSDELQQGDILVVSYPFAGNAGAEIPNFIQILDHCYDIGVDVHIDGAWFAQCRNVSLDTSHPAIKSVSISLSKAFMMGNQRIGIRYMRDNIRGPISLNNDYTYVSTSDMWIGCHMMNTWGPDVWWGNYEAEYNKIGKDFNFTPSNSFNIAYDNDRAICIRTPFRFLVDDYFDKRGYNVAK